jgi:hypothetical protein
MADQEHINILKQGMEAWNRWRNEQTDILPDLSGADLSRLHLIGFDFTGANFTGAKLVDTNLYNAKLASVGKVFRGSIVKLIVDFVGANLTRASLGNNDLTQVDFTEANLEGANLADSKLLDANLNKANLKGTFLYRTNFNEARLTETSFDNARMMKTIFGDVDLSRAKGLETVSHEGPLVIGFETIYRSKGNISETFLRKAGVPVSFLTYMHSLVNQPIEYFTCFISHSTKNKRFCDRLYTDLQANSISCWYFPEDATWGEPVWGEIDRNIKRYDKLIVICSKNSLQSVPVQREIERALNREDQERKNILFPIRIDNYLFEQWKHPRKADVLSKVVGDFNGWNRSVAKYDTSLSKLIKALNSQELTKP